MLFLKLVQIFKIIIFQLLSEEVYSDYLQIEEVLFTIPPPYLVFKNVDLFTLTKSFLTNISKLLRAQFRSLHKTNLQNGYPLKTVKR